MDERERLRERGGEYAFVCEKNLCGKNNVMMIMMTIGQNDLFNGGGQKLKIKTAKNISTPFSNL